MSKVARTVCLFLGLAIQGCSSGLSVAVDNADSVDYLLVVEGQPWRTWRIPAGGLGLGPDGAEGSRRLVFVLTMDCQEVGRLGLESGAVTMVVQGGQMADPDVIEGIARPIAELPEIANPCPGFGPG